MSRSNIEDRRLQIHAHFAWGVAFLGSGRVAQLKANYLLSPIGFYYSAFHAAYAVACTNLDVPDESLNRVGHAQLKAYIEPILNVRAQLAYSYLQDIREGINYLGADTPKGKVRIVRGHGFGFDSSPYFECVEKCRTESALFLHGAQKIIRKFGIENNINYPNLQSKWWIDEFLDEDVLRCVIPREEDGVEALKLAFHTELPELFNDTEQGYAADVRTSRD